MRTIKPMLCLFLLFACLTIYSDAQKCPTASGFTFYPYTAENRLNMDNYYTSAYGGLGVTFDGALPGCCFAVNTGCAGNSSAICGSYGFASGFCISFGGGISSNVTDLSLFGTLVSGLSSVLGIAGDLLLCSGCSGK